MSKGKQTQNTNQNTTGTTSLTGTSTPTAPDWISTAVQNIVGQIGAAGSQSPSSYVAGPTPLLNTAANAAGALTGTPWNYDSAEDVARGVANVKAPDISSLTSKFMDPYLNDVVGATSADLDHSDAQARAQDNLTMAGNGAFGGSGAALTKAATDDALSRARATTLGGLRSQGYSQALGAATSQAQLQQQQQAQRLAAAQQITDTADSLGANQRGNIATQLGVATPLQAIGQAQATAPLSLASWESSTLPDLLAKFFGQNTSGTTNTAQNTVGTSSGSSSPGLLSSLGSAATIASLFM